MKVKRIMRVSTLVLLYAAALCMSIDLIGSEEDPLEFIEKNPNEFNLRKDDDRRVNVPPVDISGSQQDRSNWSLSVGVGIRGEINNRKPIILNNPVPSPVYGEDPFQIYSQYRIEPIRRHIETKYGRPLHLLDFRTKQRVIEENPVLGHLFEPSPSFNPTHVGGGPINTLLSDLCRGDSQFYNYLHHNVAMYGGRAGYIENPSGGYTVSENTVVQQVVSMWDLVGEQLQPKGDFGESGEKLVELSRLFPFEEKARSEDAVQHHNDLLQVDRTMKTLVYPPDSQIRVVYGQLREWLDEFIKLESELPKEREDRSFYGKEQIADHKKPKYKKSLEYLGLLHKSINIPSLLEEYLRNDGLTVHRRTKETILDHVDELSKRKVKRWPCLERVRPNIVSIYKHAFHETSEGYIFKPNRAVILAQAMTLMAMSIDKGARLDDFPLGFVHETELHAHVQDALINSHWLYVISPYSSLVQRLPKHPFVVRRFCQHFDVCGGCNENPVLCKDCTLPPYIQIDTKERKFKEDKADFVTHITKLHNKLDLQIKEEDDREQAEIERAEQEEKYVADQQAQLMHSKIGDYVDYVGQKKKGYREFRDQQLFNYDLTGKLPIGQLSDAGLQLLRTNGCSSAPFSSLVNGPLQQIWQNEFISIVNECAKTKIDPNHEMGLHLSSSVVQFAEIGAWSIQTDVKETVELLADCCYAFLDLATAVAKGVASGSGQTIMQAPGFIVDPVGSIAQDCKEAYHAGCQVAAALQQVCEVRLDDMTDYSGKKEWEVGYARLNNLQQRLEHDARRVEGYNEYLQGVEDTIAAATRIGLKSIVVWVTSRAITGIAQRAAVGLGQIGPYIGNPSVTIRLDGTVTAGAAIADVITVVVQGAAEAGKAALSKWDLLPNFMKGDAPQRWERGKNQSEWDYPRDYETFLRKKDGFKKVKGRTFHGAQIYKKNGNFYHVDKLHKGPGAHIEVYNSKGTHIGTMDPVTGDWLTTKGIPGRWLPGI